jgi:hypothetical protein
MLRRLLVSLLLVLASRVDAQRRVPRPRFAVGLGFAEAETGNVGDGLGIALDGSADIVRLGLLGIGITGSGAGIPPDHGPAICVMSDPCDTRQVRRVGTFSGAISLGTPLRAHRVGVYAVGSAGWYIAWGQGDLTEPRLHGPRAQGKQYAVGGGVFVPIGEGFWRAELRYTRLRDATLVDARYVSFTVGPTF